MFNSLKLTSSFNVTANQEMGQSISPTHLTALSWKDDESEIWALHFLFMESLFLIQNSVKSEEWGVAKEKTPEQK